MDQTPDQQEVLIARDNTSGQVGAVVGQNPDGTPQMADVKSTPLSELIKFNKGQNPLEAFMSNFMRQAKNPTTFGLFKLSTDQYDKMATPMAEMLNDPETNKAMLDKYRVKAEATAIRRAPIDPNKIDWDAVEKQWGIKREQLEEKGALQQMIYNHKSPQLFTLKNNADGSGDEAKARLSIRTNADGTYSLIPHFVKKEPQLDKPFNGYTFTEEDKEALRKTGNLGKVVEIADPKTGEMVKSLVSIDKLTNEIDSIPVKDIYIKPKVANIELSMDDISHLKTGALIPNQYVELPNGQKFYADLQYNASKNDIAFVNSGLYKEKNEQLQTERVKHDNWHDESGNPKRLSKWYDIPLDEQKQAAYLAGQKVFVGETKDKRGNDCTIYLQYDPKERKPQTTWVYPDRDKVVGVAEESKTQMAVNNDGKTNEATKNVQDPLQRGQTTPKNEAQQQQQRKPRGPKPS